MKPNIVTFQEWQENSINDTHPSDMVTCPDCDGQGLVIDECSCCGHESDEECIACDGSGENRFGDLSGNDQKKVFSKQKYTEHAIKDITALAEWTSEDRDRLLIEAGFTIYCEAYNKREIVTLQEEPHCRVYETAIALSK